MEYCFTNVGNFLNMSLQNVPEICKGNSYLVKLACLASLGNATVKLVYNDYPRYLKFVAVVDRWLL